MREIKFENIAQTICCEECEEVVWTSFECELQGGKLEALNVDLESTSKGETFEVELENGNSFEFKDIGKYPIYGLLTKDCQCTPNERGVQNVSCEFCAGTGEGPAESFCRPCRGSGVNEEKVCCTCGLAVEE